MNRNVHLEVQGQGCECELGGCGSGTARNKIVMGLLVLSCREWMEHQGGFVSHPGSCLQRVPKEVWAGLKGMPRFPASSKSGELLRLGGQQGRRERAVLLKCRQAWKLRRRAHGGICARRTPPLSGPSSDSFSSPALGRDGPEVRGKGSLHGTVRGAQPPEQVCGGSQGSSQRKASSKGDSHSQSRSRALGVVAT